MSAPAPPRSARVRRAEVVVLGAGLQGTGIALELSRRGHAVTLVDQDPVPLNRASLRNEGKVHLGFIYANDASRATAFLQLGGALRFRSIVSSWLERGETWLRRSTTFLYLVATDSLLDAARLGEHYAAVERRARECLAAESALDYLGERPDALVRPLASAEIARHFAPDRFLAGFATAERAIDTGELAGALRRRVSASARVSFLPCHQVREVHEEHGRFRVEGQSSEGVWRIEAGQVVNATWERRLALDRQMGIEPPEHLLHRLKYRVIARLPDGLRGAPSVSMVLGRYGDVVVRPDGTGYLSWYPAGLQGWTHDLEPPREWDPACRGEVSAEAARDLSERILSGIDAWYPGMARSQPLTVDAGAIVAIGASDVNDAASALHDRSRIGVTSRGGYHTVDPGKLTTAPLFALVTADRVEALGGRRSAAT